MKDLFNLKISLIINKNLYSSKFIDKDTFEKVNDILIKQINKLGE